MLGAQEATVLTTFCELVVPGSAAIGAERYVERVLAAGKNTLNTFLAPALARGEVRLLTNRTVTGVRLDGTRVTGVVYQHADGSTGTVDAPVVVLAAGSLNTPQILLRSNDYIALDTPSTRLVGTTLGLHPARQVYGRFAEPQDCHMAYPITVHCRYGRVGPGGQCRDHQGFSTEERRRLDAALDFATDVLGQERGGVERVEHLTRAGHRPDG